MGAVAATDAVERIADVAELTSWLFGEDAETVLAIDHKITLSVAHVHDVPSPQGVLEEGLDCLLLYHLMGTDGVYEVRIMHHHACRFLG